jgi:hypothetical protein
MARFKRILFGHRSRVCKLIVVSTLVETLQKGSLLIVSRQHLDDILLHNSQQIVEIEQTFFSVLICILESTCFDWTRKVKITQHS